MPNSNLYYSNNLLELGEDPGEQFAWLEETLAAAQLQKEKVSVKDEREVGVM